jgi:hypothetical protein
MLPIVKYETRASFSASIDSAETPLEDAMNRMMVENPEIYLFIVEQLDKPTGIAAVIACTVAVYELLRRQDEADQMNKEWAS